MNRFRNVLFTMLLGAVSLMAQKSGWTLDKAHTNITFSIRHMVISEVTGKFKDFDITFSSSKPDFTDGAVEATIKVASINTENERRDAHLKTDDFFNAQLLDPPLHQPERMRMDD
jgi:polyisoprenoid-binding protein YceI